MVSSVWGKNEVATFVGGRVRDVLHPSVQVGQYRMYLADCHTAFQGIGAVDAHAWAYFHNYNPVKNDPLYSSHFAEQLARNPLFTADDVPNLVEFLDKRIRTEDCRSRKPCLDA